MKRAALVFLAALIAVAAWFLVSPLFIDDAVDEEFPLVLETGELDMSAVMSMPKTERRSMMQAIMVAAANAPDVSAVEPMPLASPAVVAEGRFIDADAVHKGSGRAALYQLPNGGHVVRFEDFRATNGPSLVVYLAKHPAPKLAADVVDGGFASLGKLKGNVGNQNYEVPAGIDVSEYHSVVIWCELFGVLFSPASLPRI